MNKQQRELANLVADGTPPLTASVQAKIPFEKAIEFLNKENTQEYVKKRRRELLGAYSLNKDLVQLWMVRRPRAFHSLSHRKLARRPFHGSSFFKSLQRLMRIRHNEFRWMLGVI